MVEFSTAQIALGSRAAYVNSLYAHWHGLDLRWGPCNADDLETEMSIVEFGDMVMSSHRSTSFMQKNRPLAARDRKFRYFLHLAVGAPQSFVIDGEAVELAANDFTVIDAARETERLELKPTQTIALGLREDTLRRFVSTPKSVVGKVFRADDGMPRAISNMLRSLADLTNTGTLPEIGPRFVSLLLDMLSACPDDDVRSASAGCVTMARVTKIKRHIDDNIRDPELSVDRVASALGITPRYLHMLFTTEHPNVSTYIRQQRLEGAARQLLDPLSIGRSVTDIAFSWGFNDISHFSRTFRATYGQPATTYRQGADLPTRRH